MHDTLLECCQPIRPSQIADLRLAASRPTATKQRAAVLDRGLGTGERGLEQVVQQENVALGVSSVLSVLPSVTQWFKLSCTEIQGRRLM